MDQKSQAATESPGAALERQSRAPDKPLLSEQCQRVSLLPGASGGLKMWGASLGSAPLLTLSPSWSPMLPDHRRDWSPSSQAGRSWGEGGRHFQAETILHVMIPTEQHPWKERAEQGGGKKAAKSRQVPNSSLYWSVEPPESSELHASERGSSSVIAKLRPPCRGSMENGLKIYR